MQGGSTIHIGYFVHFVNFHEKAVALNFFFHTMHMCWLGGRQMHCIFIHTQKNTVSCTAIANQVLIVMEAVRSGNRAMWK